VLGRGGVDQPIGRVAGEALREADVHVEQTPLA
jgi:hypothetical protein